MVSVSRDRAVTIDGHDSANGRTDRLGGPAGPVQSGIEKIIGGPVVEAVSQAGGFSPGTADRVRTSDGTRAFVKAVAPHLNRIRPGCTAARRRTRRRCRPTVPAPRLLGSYDDGDWIALVLEDVDGRHPHTPWLDDELDAVLIALKRTAEALTPPAGGAGTPAHRRRRSTRPTSPRGNGSATTRPATSIRGSRTGCRRWSTPARRGGRERWSATPAYTSTCAPTTC